MPVPYTFGTATSSIPLSQLDSNFATAITIGNTAVQLGNTVTTLNNLTLANVTISSGNVTITNVAVTTANVSGTANVSTMVIIGNESVGGNTTVTGNISTNSVTLTGGTANGVGYLNTSKVLTTGSTFVFDGTNVGIGTSSPTDTGAYGKALDVQGSGGSAVYVRSTTTPSTNYGYIGFTGGAGNLDIWNNPAGNIRFYNNSSERMRIDSSGNLLVGQATSTPTANGFTVVSGNVTAGKGYATHNGTSGTTWQNYFNLYWNGSAMRLYVDATDLGSITTSSDYRVKKDIQTQLTTALDRVARLRAVTYTYADNPDLLWKADGVQREGFIAHELQEVIPSAVDGKKDAENQIQSLRLDALVSVLTKAIQEQQALITALTARITALENK